MAIDRRKKTKNEIINAAVECINEQGIEGSTIRKIAAMAEVNSAAISYYFGSREELIKLAMERSLDNAFDFNDFKYKFSDDYKTVLKNIFKDWKDGAIAYPGVTNAHFDDIINRRLESDVTTNRINMFINDVYGLLIKRGFSESEKNYKKLKLCFGAFISTILMPQVAYPLNYNDEIDILVEML